MDPIGLISLVLISQIIRWDDLLNLQCIGDIWSANFSFFLMIKRLNSTSIGISKNNIMDLIPHCIADLNRSNPLSGSFHLVVFGPRNLIGGFWSLFDPCVNAMGWRPYWPSCMEVRYCTFGFSANIRSDLRTLSLPCDLLRDNYYACVIYNHAGKATHACLAGLATKKSGGTIQ